ncbi:MAG: phenylalanine--tRNA ligase subunit beta [Steroidobacteraceae bacterium]
MKITHSWIREFTPLAATASQFATQLTLAGLEVESVAPVAPPFTGVVVGEVLEVSRHPDAEKLSVCLVTTDGINRLQIICGAKNVRAGLKVAVAMVGAHLPGNISIKRAKLRGLDSMGMLCSARELGLGDEYDGILELPSTLDVNRDVREALDLDDAVIDINATPNRGDCMSVFGVARDYTAARERRYLKYHATPVAAAHQDVFPVGIASASGCPLFASRVIRGVMPQAKSPFWLSERLRRVGINSISPIVDVTNYVMIELGQPLHAYDLARLSGPITVRAAKQGERITLLDDGEYVLDPDFMVIADESGAIGLAGIMGGRTTAIGDATTEVLLECAHFMPDAIAGRARRLGLFTDAAQRFERGVDPCLPAVALERATALLLDIAGGEAGPLQVTRARDAAEPRLWVRLRRGRLQRLLGATVPDEEVRSLMRAIAEHVEPDPEGWRVECPPHRFDIRIEADLIEEVARLRGFDSIAESHAIAPQVAGYASELRVEENRLLISMVDSGYREAITYSFVDPAVQRLLFPDSRGLSLVNPISAELSEMRVSLWSGLVVACRENLRRQQSRVRLFEMGKKFDVSGGGLREVETLCAVATGARWPEQWASAREPLDFYDVKADVQNVLALTGDGPTVRFEPDSLPCLRPGRAARIFRGETPIGWLGELHPQLIKTLNLTNTLFLFELETQSAFVCKKLIFNNISKFPSVRRDLAVVVDETVTLAVLRENVSVSASDLLVELRVFDVYRGPGVDSGRKSIALGLILQDSSRTLTDVDADSVVNAVVARLRDVLSATIRDQ